ncbi:MAG: hypothetical protein KA142_13285, partial [Chromatiaceae bacterium]|nr:hypothetical protein [Chromatiaceae bacterium]
APHCAITDQPSHLNCGGLGSVTHVTATAGLFAVAVTLKRLAWPEGPPRQSRMKSWGPLEEAPPVPASTD